MACILLCSVLIALDMEKWRMLQFQSQMRMVLIVVGTRCQDRVLPAPCHAPRLIGAEVSTSYRGHHCSWPEMNDMIIASCDKKEIWFNKVDKNRTRNVNTFNWSDSIRREWRLVSFKMPDWKKTFEREKISELTSAVAGDCKVTTASARCPGPQSPAGPLLARCPRRHDAASSRQIYFHGWDCSQC